MLSIEERRAARKAFARQVRQEHARREVVTISPPLPEGRATLVQHPPLRVAIATPVLYVGGAEQWIASLCQWLDPDRALVTKAITLRRRWGTIAEETPYRTYISEPKRKRKGHRKEAHRGKRKPPAQRKAVLANRRRMKCARGKRLQRLRSEKVERTFAPA
ncbi:MAG: hypothetical protein U0935_00350 [Pirellulales bacterium]